MPTLMSESGDRIILLKYFLKRRTHTGFSYEGLPDGVDVRINFSLSDNRIDGSRLELSFKKDHFTSYVAKPENAHCKALSDLSSDEVQKIIRMAREVAATLNADLYVTSQPLLSDFNSEDFQEGKVFLNHVRVPGTDRCVPVTFEEARHIVNTNDGRMEFLSKEKYGAITLPFFDDNEDIILSDHSKKECLIEITDGASVCQDYSNVTIKSGSAEIILEKEEYLKKFKFPIVNNNKFEESEAAYLTVIYTDSGNRTDFDTFDFDNINLIRRCQLFISLNKKSYKKKL